MFIATRFMSLVGAVAARRRAPASLARSERDDSG